MMPVLPEFNVPLTPLLIASLQEVKRLQQSTELQDIEALEMLLEIISPMLKKAESNTERSCHECS